MYLGVLLLVEVYVTSQLIQIPPLNSGTYINRIEAVSVTPSGTLVGSKAC